MARSPIEDVMAKWQSRAAIARARGISPAIIHTLAQHDIQKVQQGGAAYTNEEVYAAIRSAQNGQPFVPDPKAKTGPLAVLGNVGSDVGGIIRGFIPGTINFLHHLPSETTKTLEGLPSVLAGHDAGEDVRRLAALPLASLIPGLHDVASLTTDEGRKELERHPVGAVLDVLPYVSKFGKLATAGMEVEEGSALESLQKGSPIRAGIRASADVLNRIPIVGKPFDRAAINDFLMNTTLHPKIREGLARPFAQAQRLLGKNIAKMWKDDIEPLVGSLTADERKAVYDYATTRGLPGTVYNERWENVLSAVDHLNEAWRQKGLGEGALVEIPLENGQTETFAANTNVVRKYQAMGRSAERRAAAEAKLAELESQGLRESPEGVKLQQLISKHASELRKRKKSYLATLRNNPSARFHPALSEMIRKNAMEHATTAFHGLELDSALKQITESHTWKDMESAIGKENFRAIYRDVTRSWMKLATEGFDPIWLHQVDRDAFERIGTAQPLPDRLYNPSIWKKKVFNAGPVMHDIAASVTAAGQEVLRQDVTSHFINDWVMQFTKNKNDVLKDFREKVRGDPRIPQDQLEAHAASEMKRHFRDFNPETYGVRNVRTTSPGDMVIPVGVGRSLDMMTMSYKSLGLETSLRQLPLTGTYNQAMGVYRFSVLTGPRHIAHIALGGMMMAMLREPRTLLELAHSFRQFREGTIPIEVPQHIYDFNTDQIFTLAAGGTQGRHLGEFFKANVGRLQKFEETIALVERNAARLGALRRLGPGMEQEALRESLKVFIDMDGMAPIERVAMKTMFPFYAFTRHVLKYALTYPIDHPIRAGILSRLGEQEQADWKSGLPRIYQQLLFLGSPDPKGNVSFVDYKSLNPFRSVANDFSLAGFMMSLNPVLSAPFAAAGFNTLTGSPDLYPETTFDPVSGTIVAKRKDVLPKLIGQFIPEFGALDHFFQITDRMKRLKSSSPDAYRRELFSALNIPFAYGTVNIPYEQELEEIKRMKAAQTAISRAEVTGDFTEAKAFDVVPFRGKFVHASAVEALWKNIDAQLKASGHAGLNPKAVLRPVRKARRR